MPRLSILCVCILLTCVNAKADDWTEFRGPTGQGHADATNLPVNWSNEENVTWRQEIPGTGWSSPVIYNGRIYLTSSVPEQANDSGNLALCLFSLDADSRQDPRKSRDFRAGRGKCAADSSQEQSRQSNSRYSQRSDLHPLRTSRHSLRGSCMEKSYGGIASWPILPYTATEVLRSSSMTSWCSAVMERTIRLLSHSTRRPAK